MQLATPNHATIDPNDIPVSPSNSAREIFRKYEPAPSFVTSESRSSVSPPPRSPSAPVPPIDTIPDIPDLSSKSSLALPTAKQSKLSKLASSRASHTSRISTSSRTSAIDSSSSVTTYPALRPTSKSLQPGSSVAGSSTSSHVRRAIQAAIDLEKAEDRSPTPTETRQDVEAISVDCFKLPGRTGTTSPELVSRKTPSVVSGRSSKLVSLAQSKAQLAAQGFKRTSSPNTPKQAIQGIPLPPTRTEYLTPIANGPTATTAITTSYHSLFSLTSPKSPLSRSSVPLSSAGDQLVSLPPFTELKRSKLAMKIKKAHEKVPYVAQEDSPSIPALPPIFSPKSTRDHALPSKFASLLVDDTGTVSEKDRSPIDKGKAKATTSQAPLPDDKVDRLLRHKQRYTSLASGEGPQSGTFAFDVPSPDDIVFNARRNTSLAKHGLVPTQSLKASTSRA